MDPKQGCSGGHATRVLAYSRSISAEAIPEEAIPRARPSQAPPRRRALTRKRDAAYQRCLACDLPTNQPIHRPWTTKWPGTRLGSIVESACSSNTAVASWLADWLMGMAPCIAEAKLSDGGSFHAQSAGSSWCAAGLTRGPPRDFPRRRPTAPSGLVPRSNERVLPPDPEGHTALSLCRSLPSSRSSRNWFEPRAVQKDHGGGCYFMSYSVAQDRKKARLNDSCCELNS